MPTLCNDSDWLFNGGVKICQYFQMKRVCWVTITIFVKCIIYPQADMELVGGGGEGRDEKLRPPKMRKDPFPSEKRSLQK